MVSGQIKNANFLLTKVTNSNKMFEINKDLSNQED